jgi:hypothetical protein
MDSEAAAAPTLPLMQATAPDGGQFLLAVVKADDTCVVLRNGDRIFTAPADHAGIDAAVDLLMNAVEPGFRKLSE